MIYCVGFAYDDLLLCFSTLSVVLDGTLLASRDFGFMLWTGLVNMLIQYKMLKSPRCTSLSDVFVTFAFRWGSYAAVTLLRALLGYGTLGRAIRPAMKWQPRKATTAMESKE